MARFRSDHRRKVSKVASNDTARPVLNSGRLVEVDGRWYLDATDSYQAVRVGIVRDEGDGLISGARLPLGALKALDRVGSSFTLEAEENPDTGQIEGTVTVISGRGKARKEERFTLDDSTQAWPMVKAVRPKRSKVGSFRVCLNANLLASLQAALCNQRDKGQQVVLEFPAEEIGESEAGENGATYTRPILVWGPHSGAEKDEEWGLLMPLLNSGEHYMEPVEEEKDEEKDTAEPVKVGA